MLPLCFLCPCCPCSGLKPVASLWLRAHNCFAPGAPWQEHWHICHPVPQRDEGKGLLGTVHLFGSPSSSQWSPACSAAANRQPPVVSSCKIRFLLQSQRWTFEFKICCIMWEGKEDLCSQQSWVVLGKDIESNYRSAVSLHKLEKYAV